MIFKKRKKEKIKIKNLRMINKISYLPQYQSKVIKLRV